MSVRRPDLIKPFNPVISQVRNTLILTLKINGFERISCDFMYLNLMICQFQDDLPPDYMAIFSLLFGLIGLLIKVLKVNIFDLFQH